MYKIIFALILIATAAFSVFVPPDAGLSAGGVVDKVEFSNGWTIEVSGTNLVYTYTAP